MTKTMKIITAVTVGTLIASAIVIIKNKKVALAEVSPMKSYAMLVSTIQTKKQEERLTLPYLAIVQSDKNIALSSRISSRVESIIKCGNSVHKDDVLIRLDTKELKAKKRALELQISSTKADLIAKKFLLETTLQSHKRTEALLAVKGASQESFDKEKSSISALKAALLSLKNKINILKSNISEIDTSLSYSILKSPIDGVASACFVNVGDISAPGKPLMNIESKNGKYLLVRSADNIQPKALVYEDKEYPLIPMQNTYNGLNEYRAYIPTHRSSGERVNVSLITYKAQGIRLPINALLQKENKTFCFVVKGDKAESIELKILAQGEEGMIVEGIEENKEIVLAKSDILLKLLSGVPLSVRNN